MNFFEIAEMHRTKTEDFDRLILRQYRRLKSFSEKIEAEKQEGKKKAMQSLYDLQLEEIIYFRQWATEAMELVNDLIISNEKDKQTSFAAGYKKRQIDSDLENTSLIGRREAIRELQKIKWADHL